MIEVLRIRAVWRKQRRKDREQAEQGDDHEPGRGQAMAGDRAQECERRVARGLRDGERKRAGDVGHFCTRTRGSRYPYRMSTIRLTSSTLSETAMSVACITSKSFWKIASTLIRPSPGMAKMISTKKAPASSWPHDRPITVTTGIMPGFSACLATTAASEKPFARAVRMKSWPSTSSRLERA